MNKESAKGYLTIFGVLDICSFVYGGFTIFLFFYGYNFSTVTFSNFPGPVFLLSLLVSGVLLISQKKAGIIINYIQFVFRFLVSFFSVGFLWFVISLFTNINVGLILFIIFAVLEIARLVITIIIHRKFFSKKSI
jgi:hypothetical protein